MRSSWPETFTTALCRRKKRWRLANRTLTRMVKELGVPVFVIAGNHDSNERIEYAADLLAESRLYIEGTMKEVIRKVPFQGTNFYLLPFADHVFVRETLKDDSNQKYGGCRACAVGDRQSNDEPG
jgi:DNA repair exonuclease SbcCD nuclease subunit